MRVKYAYNNRNIAADPKLTSLNFLNAMDRIPKLIEQEQAKSHRPANLFTWLRSLDASIVDKA